MKLLVAICFIAAVSAVPAPLSKITYSNQDVRVLRYESDSNPNGNYGYSWEQTDGSKAEQHGQVRNEGREDEYVAVKGSYSFITPEGIRYTVTYTADEDGYKPEIEEGPGFSPDFAAAALG